MARSRIDVTGEDGGLGYRGPTGPMIWAAFGVCSRAMAIADQEALVISNPDDADTLLGVGPLRDEVVLALTGTGTSVVVLPLQRSAGGTVLGAAARSSGTMAVTAVAGHALGGDEVVMRWSTGGAAGAASLELVVNGKPYPPWTPANAAAYGTALTIPTASLGPLANGVAVGDRFRPTVTAPTAAVAGDGVTFQFSEPQFANGDVAPAVERLAEHQLNWRFCIPAGHVSPAVWVTLDTALRMLPTTHGKYVRGWVQLAGPKLISGATADVTTAEWHSGILSAYAGLAPTGAPARVDNPRTGACTTWMTARDPLQKRDRVLPMTYALAASMSARQSWDPPEERVHGPLITDPRTRAKLLDVKAIHPADIRGSQIDAQDDIWLTTLQKESGRGGVWLTHARLWGVYPTAGVEGSDYIGAERGFLMDELCTDVANRLFATKNAKLETGPDGRLSQSARDQLEGLAAGGIEPFKSIRAIAAGEAIAMDKAPGILQTSTTQIRLRVQPFGKNEVIEATVGYVASLAIDAEVAEEVAA